MIFSDATKPFFGELRDIARLLPIGHRTSLPELDLLIIWIERLRQLNQNRSTFAAFAAIQIPYCMPS